MKPYELKFGRDEKPLGFAMNRAMPGISPTNQALQDEILTFSLTNTFSTIQSLEGELTALRKMSKKPTFDKKKKHNIKSTVVRDFTD